METSCEHHLMEDLLIDILSRLPVKSLLRFQCVCKVWYALIKNPSFISKHFYHPNNHTRLLAHYQSHSTISHIRALAVFPDETLIHHQYIDYDYLQMSQTLYGIHGPINGLFLLHTCDFGNPWSDRLALWNPATKECSPLPVPSFNLPQDVTPYGHRFGFGLDPLTRDYKVVWTRRLSYGTLDTPADVAVVAALYTLHNDSWRQLDTVLDSVLNICSFRFAYLDGAYYWLSMDRDDNVTIVLFDMSTEEFREIHAPPDHPKSRYGDLFLYNDDSIALILYEYSGESFGMWIMKPEGCWSKHFTLGPLQEIPEPIGFWKNDEMIVETRSPLPPIGVWTNDGFFLETKRTSQLTIYNSNNRETRNLGIHGCYFYVCHYKESLASVKGRGII